MKRSLALLGLPALLLAGCIEIGSPGPGPEGAEVAIASCRAQALDERLNVQEVTDLQSIRGAGGRVIGQDVGMRVQRGFRTYTVRCSYTFATGRAVIRTA